jgi:23S rRNA (uracil1939-C5)-methyltransferase
VSRGSFKHRKKRTSRPNKPSLPKEEMTVSVQSIGAKGDGLGVDENGNQYFVPLSVAGDVVKLKVTDKRGDHYVGKISEIITAGTDRTDAPCPYYGACGGCNLQHLNADAYQGLMVQKVSTALSRSDINATPDTPFMGSAGTRRRASFAVMRKGKKILFGFNGRGSHRIEEIETCLLLTDRLNNLIAEIRSLLPHVMKQEGRGDIIMNAPYDSCDIVFSLPGRPDLKAHERLVDFAERLNISRMSWQENSKGEPETILQREAVITQFSDIPVELPPAAFLQPSKEGETALVDFALSALSDEKKILDLYAGCGSFTFALAKHGIVHAVESYAPAMKALERSAGRANLGGRISCEVRDLDRQPLMGKELSKYDAVLFDPPRAGAQAQAEELAKSNIALIIAISCNPATFSRDAQALINGGYMLEKLMPVDQFVWSDHVEVAAIFSKTP